MWGYKVRKKIEFTNKVFYCINMWLKMTMRDKLKKDNEYQIEA